MSTSACFAQSGQQQISKERVGNVLSCLITKLGPKDFGPQQSASGIYKVRYFYGILTPDYEKDNELQLFVFHADGAEADFYRVYFDKEKGGQDSIYIGDGGSIKKEKGHWVPDEISGGLASYDEMVKVTKQIEKQPDLIIEQKDVVSGNYVCVFDQ
ncbi:MAG TPA: hypothetical protein VF651_11520 [Gammaproteobacteria bacterium]